MTALVIHDHDPVKILARLAFKFRITKHVMVHEQHDRLVKIVLDQANRAKILSKLWQDLANAAMTGFTR